MNKGTRNNSSDQGKSFGSSGHRDVPAPMSAAKNGRSVIDTLDQLRKELHAVSRERDDAMYRLQEVTKEVDTLRQSVNEARRIRAVYDQLSQV
jgi:hypothetical protein